MPLSTRSIGAGTIYSTSARLSRNDSKLGAIRTLNKSGEVSRRPFTDLDDQGVSWVFAPAEVQMLVETLGRLNARTGA